MPVFENSVYKSDKINTYLKANGITSLEEAWAICRQNGLDIFQIIMGIEETYDIEIDNEEAEKIVTVGDAVEQIKNATNN